MKQLTIFDSIDQPEPGKRRQTSGRSANPIILTQLLKQCESQQNANSITLYDYPEQVLSVSDLQTMARGNDDFCLTEKEAVIIESLNGRKLFGPHLLIGFKNALRKLEIKRKIEKRDKKARIVVKLPEADRLRAAMLDG